MIGKWTALGGASGSALFIFLLIVSGADARELRCLEVSSKAVPPTSATRGAATV